MFLVHGLSGLVLVRLLLLTLIGFAEVLSLAGAWFLGGGAFCSGLSGLVVTGCGRLEVTLLMLMMLLMSSCIVTLQLLPCLICGVGLRRFMGVLDAMIRCGISLARSVELTAQWDRVLAAGPLYLVTLDDLDAVRGLGLGDFHRRLSDFVHGIVVHRRDEAIRGWRNWIREDPMVHPKRWLRPDLVPPAPFLQCKPHLTLDGSGLLADPAKIDQEFRKAWLPYNCRSGQRDTSLEEFDREVD